MMGRSSSSPAPAKASVFTQTSGASTLKNRPECSSAVTWPISQSASVSIAYTDAVIVASSRFVLFRLVIP